jgi:hypothetical protein
VIWCFKQQEVSSFPPSKTVPWYFLCDHTPSIPTVLKSPCTSLIFLFL